jgi:hypothetical protein
VKLQRRRHVRVTAAGSETAQHGERDDARGHVVRLGAEDAGQLVVGFGPSALFKQAVGWTRPPGPWSMWSRWCPIGSRCHCCVRCCGVPFEWTATADEILAKVKIVQANVKKLVDNDSK